MRYANLIIKCLVVDYVFIFCRSYGCDEKYQIITHYFDMIKKSIEQHNEIENQKKDDDKTYEPKIIRFLTSSPK